MLDKLKNLKFSNLKGSKNSSEIMYLVKNLRIKLKVFQNFPIKSKKMSVVGEEIAGLDITKEAIRVAQVSQDKEETDFR